MVWAAQVNVATELSIGFEPGATEALLIPQVARDNLGIVDRICTKQVGHLNTPSHWLMTIAAGKLWLRRSAAREKGVPRWALGLGSIAPDLALYGLSFGGIFYYSQWLGWPLKKTFEHMYSDAGLYFNDPYWIGLHNLLHSPTSLMLFAIGAWLLRRRFPNVTRWCLFFLTACAAHSVIDIVTHHDDGPLLFFPFEWTVRFQSPVSYWDTAHHGGIFMIFEVILLLVLSVFVVLDWRKHRSQRA